MLILLQLMLTINTFFQLWGGLAFPVILFHRYFFKCLFVANCAPPCQNGGMCLRPQLCVCKPGTKGNSCEDTVMQDTSSTEGRNPVAPPWPIPQQAAQQTFSRKVQVPPKVGPMTQMAFTIKQKPPVGLPQQMQPQ